MKYDEEEILGEILDYIKGTYKQHYVSADEEEGVQLVDVWNLRGSAVSSCLDTAMKYPIRFGRKNGHNETDLFKAVHYLILALHFSRKSKQLENKAVLANVQLLTERPYSIGKVLEEQDKAYLTAISIGD